MTKQEVGKPTAAHTSSLAPAVTVIGEFSVDSLTCEIICVHGASDKRLSTEMMVKRGKFASAYMRMVDGDFLFLHRKKIPSSFSQNLFLFPMWTSEKEDGEDDGFVRGLDMIGVDWWCLMKYPNIRDWDKNCVMLRLAPLRLPSSKK